MDAGAEYLLGSVKFDLVNLAVGKTRSKAGPVGSTITGDIDAVFGSDIELTGRVVDLERPDRHDASTSGYRSKVAADVSPGGSAIDRFENIAAGAKGANNRVCCRTCRRINLDVLDLTGNGQIMLSPIATVVGSDEEICISEAAGVVRCCVNRIWIGNRKTNSVNETVRWIPSIDSHSAEWRPDDIISAGDSGVRCFPDLVGAVQHPVARSDKGCVELLVVDIASETGAGLGGPG